MRLNQLQNRNVEKKQVKKGGGNTISHKKHSQIKVEPLFDDEDTDVKEEQQKEETIGEILIKLETIDDDTDSKEGLIDLKFNGELKKERRQENQIRDYDMHDECDTVSQGNKASANCEMQIYDPVSEPSKEVETIGVETDKPEVKQSSDLIIDAEGKTGDSQCDSQNYTGLSEGRKLVGSVTVVRENTEVQEPSYSVQDAAEKVCEGESQKITDNQTNTNKADASGAVEGENTEVQELSQSVKEAEENVGDGDSNVNYPEESQPVGSVTVQ